jgi:hypothetical protein
VLERPRQGSNVPAFARERSRSIVVRSSAPVREAQSSSGPVLEVLVLGFWLILVAQ